VIGKFVFAYSVTIPRHRGAVNLYVMFTSARYYSGTLSYLTLLNLSSNFHNHTISVTTKMATEIIFLVNAIRNVPKTHSDWTKQRHSRALYYKAAALETFPIVSEPTDYLPVSKTPGKEETVQWENDVWGTSLCNTICSPLSVILSCRCQCGTEADHSVRSRSHIQIFT